jgi:hypothetical protein
MLKNRYIGLKIIITPNHLSEDSACSASGKLENSFGRVWECTNVIRTQEGLQLLSMPSFSDNGFGFLVAALKTADGLCAITDLSSFCDNRNVFTPKQVEKLKNKFGVNTFNLLVNRKIKIGMTKEMVRWALGEPDRINNNINAGGKHEQWVYNSDGSYYYFDNGILTTIQN